MTAIATSKIVLDHDSTLPYELLMKQSQRQNLEILVELHRLKRQGKPALIEVWYPWDTIETFDVLVLDPTVDGGMRTLETKYDDIEPNWRQLREEAGL